MTSEPRKFLRPLILLTSLFFMWGLITSLNDILIPHLKAAFELTYAKAMLVQFCFFGAYFVMSFPSGNLVEKAGYKAGMVVGLLVAGVGCALFYPAADLRSYGFFLGALFVLASGITLLQVAANPYVTVLGRPETASARLTLTQAFNSLGTTIGPLFGSAFILAAIKPGMAETDAASRAATEAAAVQGPYVGLAIALFVIAGIILVSKLPQVEGTANAGDAMSSAAPNAGSSGSLWSHRHLVLGALGIFVYVGAEVAIGSLLVNFMVQPQIGGLSEERAGQYLALYWGGAMVGRFIGAAVMARVRPGTVLGFNACAAVALLVLAISTQGALAMWALLLVGLCNSIMFPTIFSLGLAGLGRRTGEGSGLLCMAIVGGAIVPLLQGVLADRIGLSASFVLPLVCYLYIAHYGLRGHRPRLGST